MEGNEKDGMEGNGMNWDGKDGKECDDLELNEMTSNPWWMGRNLSSSIYILTFRLVAGRLAAFSHQKKKKSYIPSWPLSLM